MRSVKSANVAAPSACSARSSRWLCLPRLGLGSPRPHVPHSTGSMFSPLVSEEGVHRGDCGGIVGDDANLAPAGKRGKPILNHRLFLPHGGGPGYLLAVDEPRNAE